MSVLTSPRQKALIVLSSAHTLPLAEPVGHPGLSTGFFLVELAAVMAAFEDTHDFILATPDGNVPQLDVNGLALNFHAAGGLGGATARTTIQGTHSTPARLREKNPDLLARRESELGLARRHLGRIPLSQPLPKTDKEAVSIRDAVAASFEALPAKRYFSIPELIRMHGDPDAAFSLDELAFVHMPGGHGPMVDFHDNPQMGELLHRLRQSNVPISLICHAPVALTSARYRVDERGTVTIHDEHAFSEAQITTVPKYGERFMLETQYPKVPGQRTRLPYYVDVALKEAGYNVELSLNPTAVKVIWDQAHGVLTGNGPQSIDAQAERLTEIVHARSPRAFGAAETVTNNARVLRHRGAGGQRG